MTAGGVPGLKRHYVTGSRLGNPFVQESASAPRVRVGSVLGDPAVHANGAQKAVESAILNFWLWNPAAESTPAISAGAPHPLHFTDKPQYRTRVAATL